MQLAVAPFEGTTSCHRARPCICSEARSASTLQPTGNCSQESLEPGPQGMDHVGLEPTQAEAVAKTI